MKLGAENRLKTIIAVGLMLSAALVAVRSFTRPTPAVVASAPAPNAADQQRRTPARTKRNAPAWRPTADPRLRLDLLRASESVAYAGSGRNIFRPQEEPIPQPKVPVIVDKQPPAPPPGPPPPPPITLRFFGFASRQGEPKKVFLADGEDVFVAGEGEIVNRRYKVLHIGVNTVEIQDILNNNTQTIPMTQG